MKTYTFEKLECWQLAREVTAWIYTLTRQFPIDEKFGLTSQMRRAAISIISNLAEGTSRASNKEQMHFSTISYSSAIELINQLIISHDLKIISTPDYNLGRCKIERLTYLIAMLKKSQQLKESARSSPR